MTYETITKSWSIVIGPGLTAAELGLGIVAEGVRVGVGVGDALKATDVEGVLDGVVDGAADPVGVGEAVAYGFGLGGA